MRGLVITYRDGAEGPLLRTELARRFGADLVSTGGGAEVATAAALVVVIGPDWLLADEIGWRRIDDPHDPVRRELRAAFEAGVCVVPVVTGGATMPVPQELPADVAALGRCPCWPLRPDQADADRARIADALAALPVS
jgi:hypothetical protein